MIFRVTQKLGSKIRVSKLDSALLDANPYADWSCHLFTANRAQYIILSNTVSLYSCVMRGAGIIDANVFNVRACEAIRDLLIADGQQSLHEQFIAPSSVAIGYAKALNRGVTGSMNDLINRAKYAVEDEGFSPHAIATELNDILLSYLGTSETNGYDRPANAFRRLH